MNTHLHSYKGKVFTLILACGGAILFALPAAAQLTPAEQAGLWLGPDQSYAIVDLGSGTTSNEPTFGWNSGPVDGSILIGQDIKTGLSGGDNGGFTNSSTQFLYTDGTASGVTPGTNNQLQSPITVKSVSTSVTQTAATYAQNVSNYAAGLTATETVGSLTSPTTITGSSNAAGGLTVVDVTGGGNSIQNVDLTISGNANDYFVFNVAGAIQTNQPMTLSGGVTANHILFNLTGTGTVLQTSGGAELYGTYLSTDGGDFQFSGLNESGHTPSAIQLIDVGKDVDGQDVGGNMQFVSNSTIPTFVAFVPEPQTYALLALALGCLLVMKRRRA